MSAFSGISSALSALQAQRKAMDVIGQNIANASTPGYTRQRAELTEVVESGTPRRYTGTSSPTAGNGVAVSTVSRASDAFLQARVDQQTGDHALLQGRAQTLSDLESLTNEPGSNGLSEQLNGMWASWNDVALHPTSDASRTVVLQASQTVVDTIRSGYQDVQSQFTSQLGSSAADVTEVNSTAASVADYNQRIQDAVVTGGSANELMDQRDQLVTRLAELTGSTSQAGQNGQVDVFLGGTALVQGNRAAAVSLQLTSSTGATSDGTKATMADIAAGGTLRLVSSSGGGATPPSGALGAGLQALGTTLPQAAAGYDALAQSVATQVNALQQSSDGHRTADADGNPGTALFTASDGRTGADGGPVFTATTLTVALTDGRKLAAGMQGGGSADGSNAAAVAAQAKSTTGTDALWKKQVAVLGASSAAATTRATSAQTVLTASVTDQQGQSGVSLDEEAADLISAQRAYQAAARVLTAVDECLDTLINGTAR